MLISFHLAAVMSRTRSIPQHYTEQHPMLFAPVMEVETFIADHCIVEYNYFISTEIKLQISMLPKRYLCLFMFRAIAISISSVIFLNLFLRS